MTRNTLEVLDSSGHLTLEWDPNDETEIAAIRAEVARLKAAGYSFFLVEGTPADEVAAGSGSGKLVVRRIDDPADPPVQEPTTSSDSLADQPKRGHGGQRSVAMRPMRGG
ncbi:MAG: hypothetical protein WC718_14940 [Phycisphaerales bacterium]|jgi:hypothetical protein